MITGVRQGVSIHARSTDRAILEDAASSAWEKMFQSTPDQQTGRYLTACVMAMGAKCFNPRPINRPGDTK